MIDLPLPLILPDHLSARPAIIRPAVNVSRYFPVAMSRVERRALVSELQRTGRVERSMLPGMIAIVTGRRGPASQQYIGWTEVIASTSAYNFTNVNVGTPSGDRYIVIVLFFSGGPTAASSTVSVNGVTLTSRGGIAGAAIYSGLVPTGTLVNVNITSNVNGDRCGFATFAATGLRNGGAVSDIKTSSSTAANVTLNTNVPAEGICIAGRKSNFSHTATWNNITERIDKTVGQPTYTAASIDVPAGNAALAVNCVFSGTADAPGFVSASFR